MKARWTCESRAWTPGDLVRDVPAVPLRLEGKVGGTIKGTMPAATGGERSFDADVDLSAPKLRVQGLPTEKLTGTVNYRKGVGEYHLKGGLLGGTFELDGRIPPRPAAEGAPPAKPTAARQPPAHSAAPSSAGSAKLWAAAGCSTSFMGGSIWTWITAWTPPITCRSAPAP